MRNATHCASCGSSLLCALGLLCAAVLAAAPAQAQKTSDPDRIWIHRNLGSAYFADESFTEAAKELGAVAALPEAQPGDQRNAGIAFLLAKDYPAAHEALEKARSLEPRDPRTAYAAGILAKRESNLDAARTAFLECRELGGTGPELDYNLGIVESRLNNLEGAQKEFRAAVDLGPNNAPRHYASSLYRLGRTLIQMGQRDEGAKAMASYQELVKAGAGAQLSEEDLERGPLLELTELDRPPDVRAAGPLPAFKLEPIPAGDIRWAVSSDFDQDGDSD
ncbi:MAG TPA: tetratricopeptide repeat protein, partial [bacterium]|nr:tetratricopeptide repeat protein [bacterium]